MATNLPLSSYLQYLPATFQSQKIDAGDAPSPTAAPDPFLGRFLMAFERLLSGLGSLPDPPLPIPVPPSIEDQLAGIPKYFVPQSHDPSAQVPADFLPWLAGWVAVSLRGDWSEAQQRAFIAKIPSLYRLRGTKACMQEMLATIVPGRVDIEESTTVPHYFTVTFTLPDASSSNLYQRTVRAIIDQEKPAHTFYGLNMIVPTPMTIPVIIGVTTILGTAPTSSSSSSSSGNRS